MSHSGQGVTGADSWLSRLYKSLAAPLLITVVGAVLAGYLIPRITSQIEDHRKAREIQTALVQDMSEAVAAVLATGRLVATATIPKADMNTTAVFNESLVEWETSRASIGARLGSYFEGTTIPQAWDDYSAMVDRLYYLSTTQLKTRCADAIALKAYLEPGTPEPRCTELETDREPQACRSARDRWRILGLCDEDSLKESGKGYVRRDNFFRAYRSISDMLIAHQRSLLDAVRTSTPAGF